MREAHRVFFIAAAALLLCITAGYPDVMTAANAVLRQPVSARPLAVADAFTGLTDDINSISYNPAGLARMSSHEFAAMYSENSSEHVNYGFVGCAFHFSDSFNVGISGNLRNNGQSNSVYTLSYGLKVIEKKDVGVTTMGFNIRYLEGSLDSTDTIYSYVGDVGLLSTLYLADKPVGIGLCLQNLGGEVLHTNGDTEAENLPVSARAGIAYTFGPDIDVRPINLSADITYIEEEQDPRYSIGAEYWFSGGIALRLGYKLNYENSAESLTAGLGFKYGTVRFDCAMVALDSVVGYEPKISFIANF